MVLSAGLLVLGYLLILLLLEAMIVIIIAKITASPIQTANTVR